MKENTVQKRQYIHQFELDIKLNPHDWYKTLCFNQDEASSHR